MTSLLSPELLAMRGTKASYTAPEPLGEAAIRYFALAIGATSDLYFDAQAALQLGYQGIVAPPTLICETNQFYSNDLNSHGYIGHIWDIEIPNTRLLRGGNKYQFLQPVHPTDIVSVEIELSEIFERTSSNGTQMVFLISVATYTNQTNIELARDTETLILQSVHKNV